LYEYEKALINQKLDTAIKQQELYAWYEKLKTDFPLEQDVFLLFFIKLKPDAPNLVDARKWIAKPKELEGYCKEYATSYVTDNGMWYEEGNVLKNFPVSQGDLSLLSSAKSFREYKTEEGSWFIKIGDVIKKGDPSPLEFIREQMVKAIIEKRRIKLVERVYDKIYQDGIKSKSFEVLVK